MRTKWCSCGSAYEGKFCPECSVKRKQEASAYGRDWRKLRERILRKHPLCVDCMESGKVRPAEEVHHIITIADAPHLRLDPSNLATLCKKCHRRRHECHESR